MKIIKRASLYGLLGCIAFQTQAEQLSVTKIDSSNAATLIKGGPDAIGGLDDIHLSNGVVCAVISAVEHEGEFSSKGGALIDLGFCDRNDDHYSFSSNLLDGSRSKPVDNHSLRIERADNEVSVVAMGSAPGATLETRYTLDSKNRKRLKISKTLTRVNSQEEGFNLFSSMSFNYHSLETFIFNSKDPSQTIGFNNQDFVTRGMSGIGDAASAADTIIYLSPPDAEYPIAYGWQIESAMRISPDRNYKVPYYALADEESTAFLILSDDFWVGDGKEIGLLQLPQIALMGLDVGESLQIEERIYLSDRADAASITDHFYRDSPQVTLPMPDANSALHVDFPDGTPFTFVRGDSTENFSFRAPPGNYVLRHRGTADRQTRQEITVSKLDNQRLQSSRLPDVARLRLPQGEAMRIVFKGINGTQDPDFVDPLTDYNVQDGDVLETRERISALYLAGIPSDPSSIMIPPGEYQVYATRGLEYGIEQTSITLSAGETKSLKIKIPQRQVDTPDFIAADLHVHAGNSFDNTFSNDQRVRTFVAEHGEVMVASEHDTMFDFAPLIREMGVDDKIVSIIGSELTSLLKSKRFPYTGGHVNFFPVTPKPLHYRKGVIKHEDRRLREVIAQMRTEHQNVFTQLNHARRNLSLSDRIDEDFPDKVHDGAFFDHMGIAAHPFEPHRPLTAGANATLVEIDPSSGIRDLDFDGMEIVNPGGETHQERLDAVRRDWMSLLLQGQRVTGTANSDSHRKAEQVAVPRNMVAVVNDEISQFNQNELIEALRKGKSYGTTGPMLKLNLSGKQMGEMFAGSKATLTVSINTADWITVDRLVVQVNAQTVEDLEVTGNSQLELELEFTKDAFVTVEVHGPINQAYSILYPQIAPYAFSNPIYVDANSDGWWQPPGLDSDEQLPIPPIKINEDVAMPEHEKINYLEYPAKNIEASKKFFEQVFGWQFVDYGPDYTAFSNQGVDGGFYASDARSRVEDGAALTVFYSANLEDTQARIEQAGGTINVPIFSFPGGRRFHFIEPSGNEFSVWGDPE